MHFPFRGHWWVLHLGVLPWTSENRRLIVKSCMAKWATTCQRLLFIADCEKSVKPHRIFQLAISYTSSNYARSRFSSRFLELSFRTFELKTRKHCCLTIKAISSLKLTSGTVLQNVFIPRKPVLIPDKLSQFGWTFKSYKFIKIFFALILPVAKSGIYQSHFAGAFEIGSVVWKIQIATRCKNCWTSLQVLIRRNSIIECAIQFRTEALSGKLTRPARKSSNNVWT